MPHASTVIPREVREQFILNDEELTAEAIESADLHTDELARAAWPSARILTANVSRLVVDVERFADDSEEQMANLFRISDDLRKNMAIVFILLKEKKS